MIRSINLYYCLCNIFLVLKVASKPSLNLLLMFSFSASVLACRLSFTYEEEIGTSLSKTVLKINASPPLAFGISSS